MDFYLIVQLDYTINQQKKNENFEKNEKFLVVEFGSERTDKRQQK